MKIILIMGLPGSGKTTLAAELAPMLNAKRLNADEVRKEANDWDFSEEGRKRQAKRMSDFALKLKEQGFQCCSRFYMSNTRSEKSVSC
jgi:adenylylsulfate kinase